MKKTVIALGAALVLASAPTMAFDFDGKKQYKHSQKMQKSFWKKAKGDKRYGKKHKGKYCKDKPVVDVPEIDGAHAGLALALLMSAFAVMRERKLRK